MTGSCYGNLASDGRLIQTVELPNANFGIRADGTLVAGYLSQDDAASPVHPFAQLVSGVVWLVRDGVNYVQQSRSVEYAGVEETGSLDLFTAVLAARSAVGFDKDGVVYLVQVDGHTFYRGLGE